MNGKVLVSVTLPATGKSYDLWIPPTMEIHEASSLIAGILDARESDFFSKQDHQSLMLKSSGEILDASQTIEELGFLNGTQLVLV